MSRSATDEAEKLGGEFNTDFASKSALVTGGAGFLGSWLCDALVASGANVYCVDNLSTGKLENVRDFQSQGKITIGDVESVELLGDFDFVFHFASRASPEEYQTRPIETLSANSAGTLRMLRYAAEHESVMVFASSSEVYGDAKVGPTPDIYFGNVNPTWVRSCYDEGKSFGEAL